MHKKKKGWEIDMKKTRNQNRIEDCAKAAGHRHPGTAMEPLSGGNSPSTAKAYYMIMGTDSQEEAADTLMRCKGFTASAYQWLVEQAFQEDGHLCPVVPIVLYFGTDPWSAPTTLWEMTDIPEKCKPLISDFRMNLIQVAFLEDDTIRNLSGILREVAKFFRAKRLGKDRRTATNGANEWAHAEEMMELFRQTTGMGRSGQKQRAFLAEEVLQGVIRICTILDLPSGL